MKYAIIATATFLGTLALIAAIVANHVPELTLRLNEVSEGCGIVALALFMYYAFTDAQEMFKDDNHDRK